MESKEFVISEIKKIENVIENIIVRCAYKEDLHTYFIEVSPDEIYQYDIRYLGWERQLHHEFIKQYPLENVCFIPAGCHLKLSNFIYETFPKDCLATTIARKVPYYRYS